MKNEIFHVYDRVFKTQEILAIPITMVIVIIKLVYAL